MVVGLCVGVFAFLDIIKHVGDREGEKDIIHNNCLLVMTKYTGDRGKKVMIHNNCLFFMAKYTGHRGEKDMILYNCLLVISKYRAQRR